MRGSTMDEEIDRGRCVDRAPVSWCSCDRLRRAEAERDRYRYRALIVACKLVGFTGACPKTCHAFDADAPFPCAAVIEEVDGA